MPRRILFLEHNVDGSIGGSHVCLLSICKHLDRSSWEPVVCFYQENTLIQEFKDLNVEVWTREPYTPWVIANQEGRPKRQWQSILQSIVNLLRMTVIRPWTWVKFLRQSRIHVVHLNNSCAGDVDLVIAAKILRLRTIAHQRGFPPRFARFERFIARRLDKIIAVSDAVRVHLVEQGIPAQMITMIHDGIEIDQLHLQSSPENQRRALGISPGRLIVGMLGNIKQWKGQEVLVDAMPMISLEFPHTSFLFIGQVADEEYKARLDKKIEAAGLTANVCFMGYRSNAVELIEMMDVVVHASIEAEPFGLVVLEAMGKGKPIVATNLGGPKETVIDGATGLLFESGNPESLSSAVCQFLASPTFRLEAGAAGAAHVRARFSAERNARRIEAAYSAYIT